MKCKNCQAELEDDVTVCPGCGFDNSGNAPEETPAQEQPAEETAEETAAQQPAEESAEQSAEASAEEPAEEPAEESAEESAADAAETKPEKMTPGMTPGKIVLLVVLAIAAIAVVIALIVGGMKGSGQPTDGSAPTVSGDMADVPGIPEETTEATIPADGNPDDVTCKGSYSVSDEDAQAARDTVVATLGDAQLTNSQLQIYYWMQFYDLMNMYGNYTTAIGLNPLQSLDTQKSIEGELTWQQFLLDGAIENWRNYQAMAMEAEKAGFALDPKYSEFLEKLPEELLTNAKTYGYETAEEMIQGDMGKGASLADYLFYMETYYRGYDYYANMLEQQKFTDTEIEAYFDEHADEYAETGLDKETRFVDARHILIQPKGGTADETGRLTYSDEEWEACRAEAQAILDSFLAGDQTEESFAKLAEEKTQDPGSMQNGGLYTDIYRGQMVQPFDEWCFDETREAGDTGLVKTDYGYHIMYFKESRPAWIQSARADLLAERGSEILHEILEHYELNVDYSAIKLGVVDMNVTD